MADWLEPGRAQMCFEKGAWEEALAAVDDFLARDAMRYLESPCRIVRGHVLLARGDRQTALDEGSRSLKVAREVRDAQILHPALAFAARASLAAGHNLEAHARAEELLETWSAADYAGYALPASLPDLDRGRGARDGGPTPQVGRDGRPLQSLGCGRTRLRER
jgi:hypothetical protein